MNDICDKYLNWLINFVESESLPRDRFGTLYLQLMRTEFTWIDSDENDIYMDENRAADGLDLRRKFCRDQGVDFEELSNELSVGDRCSILEMMVAFARRIDEDVMWDNEYGDRTDIWFWYMIYALRLDACEDGYSYSLIGVKRKLNKFLRRQYGLDGYGGLFYLEVRDWKEVENYFDYIPDFYPTMNSTELWQQMGIWTQLYSAGIIIRHLGD